MFSLNTEDAKSVLYTGTDIESLGVKKGDNLDTVVGRIATYLSSQTDINIANLKCLYTDCGDENVDVPTAVESILDFLCGQNADTLRTSSQLFSLGNTISAYATDVVNRTMTWSSTLGSTGVNFNYSLQDMVGALPQGATIVSVQAVGNSAGGKFADSNQISGGFNIPFARVPASVDIRVRVRVNNTNVDFSNIVSVVSAQNQGPFNTELYPSATSSFRPNTELSQRQYNEILAAEISNQKSRLENLLNIQLTQYPNLTYPTRDFNTVLQVQNTKIAELLNEVQQLKDTVQTLQNA